MLSWSIRWPCSAHTNSETYRDTNCSRSEAGKWKIVKTHKMRENWRPTLDFILPAKRLAPGRSTINVHDPDQVKSSRKVNASARVAILCGILFLCLIRGIRVIRGSSAFSRNAAENFTKYISE